METISTLQQAERKAHERWGSRVHFIEKTNTEASSPCPWCGGNDRFLIFAKGNYWCRPGEGHCGRSGWILEEELETLTSEERKRLALQAEVEEVKKKLADHERRITALEKIAKSQAHILYHKGMTEKGIQYWHDAGITDESIDKRLLGYCSSIPLYPSLDSVTIPVVNFGVLRNIRHRAFSDKIRYLPQMKGLGLTLYNADTLKKPDKSMLILFEGEKKAIVASQYGFDGPALLGSKSFKDEWVPYFRRFKTVYVCLDTDARDSAVDIAERLGNGRIVELPGDGKVDDLFNWGMTPQDFCNYLRKAKRV